MNYEINSSYLPLPIFAMLDKTKEKYHGISIK